MNQKVIKVGSSAAVTIPKGSLETLGFSVGSKVSVSIDPKAKRMVVESAEQAVEDSVDKETLAWTKEFIKEYEGALKELADK